MKNNNPDNYFMQNSYVPSNQNKKVTNDGNYKTQLCKLHQSGYCKYGTNCTFAHGDSELRPSKSQRRAIHNKLKASVSRLFGGDDECNAYEIMDDYGIDEETLALNMMGWDSDDRDYAFLDHYYNSDSSSSSDIDDWRGNLQMLAELSQMQNDVHIESQRPKIRRE